MTKAHQGKVAIVTGSATGLGAAVALQLVDLGFNVTINYTKSEAEAKQTVAACEARGAETLMVRANVAEDADCQRLAAETMAKWGRIDVLVNNAGTTTFAPGTGFDVLTADDFQWVYAVNVVGPYQMIRACAPHLKASGAGSVVNVSSVAGITGEGSSVAYAASKGALNLMTKSLGKLMGPEIRVNSVCPGMIQSRWLKNGLGEERYEAMIKGVEKNTPLQVSSTPEDIAETVIWFAVGARHTTGETQLVDAGLNLGPPRRI